MVEAQEVDKIEDALLAALAFLTVMNNYLIDHLDPEEALLETTMRKLREALERWREIESVWENLQSPEFN